MWEKLQFYSEFTSNCGLGASYSCGVYGIFIFDYEFKKVKCLYIGSSKNIFKRIMDTNHIYRILLNAYDGSSKYIISSMEILCNDYKTKEIELIKKYNPIYNKQHKGIELWH